LAEIIRTKKDLKSIESGWNELADTDKSPLMNYEWFVSCIEAFYREEDLRIIVIYSQDNITAIAPLISVKINFMKRLEFIGMSYLFEPCSFLYESEDALRLLLKEIIKLKCPLYLQRLPENSTVSRLLKELTRYRGVFIERQTSGSAYVSLNSEWEKYLNSFSPKRRYELRLKRRRAEKLGNVQIRIFCPKPEELDSYLDMAFKIESEGWKGREESALLYNSRLQLFIRQYAALACEQNILRLCFFCINEKAVAMIIGLESKDRFWIIKIGYEEKWKKCSPGMQLTLETIRYAFLNRLESYEFLGSDDSWKKDWTDSRHPNMSLGYFPFSITGVSQLIIDIGQYIVRKVLKK
jgi:CelD/BcsL family acetyltransferase involved in cellulose biosynthesis